MAFLFGGVFDSLAGFALNIIEGVLVNRHRIDEFPDPVIIRNNEPAIVLNQPNQAQEHNKRRKVELSDLVDCKSQNEHVDMVVGWLKDDKITTVGVYGMGGVGKTTLAKLVQVRLVGGVLYSDTGARVVHVGWVSVGLHFDVYKVQEELAEAFGFDIEYEKDVTRRASLVSAHLSRSSGCVVILDDLWTGFCREEVGIPMVSKLVLVSRSWDVCRVLHCQKLINVEPLSEEESWLLFCHTLQCAELDSEEIWGIARHVCQECGGVPLAINAVASSMRGVVDASVWNNVLDCLRRLPSRLAYLEDIFNILRPSYESLSNKLKSCLLYCALYPENYSIREEELICLWLGDMLLGDADSLQALYDMGHSILKKLMSSCLVDISGHSSRVKIHRLTRDLALSIAGDSFMVQSCTESEWHEDLHAVSLINSNTQVTLESSPKCPNLRILLLQHNELHELPDSFFLWMSGLRVLNMSYTSIERLPSSFSTLEELRVLNVSWCENLRQMPCMAKLKKLHFLDLSHTAIAHVPRSFSTLRMLTELNLSCTPELVKFPKGVFSALSSLKRLSCEIAGTMPELLSLKCLEMLDVKFSNIRDLGRYVKSRHWRTLECFHLQVGRKFGFEGMYSKWVSLNGCSLNGRGDDYIVLPDDIQMLNIEDCTDFNSLSDIMNSVDGGDKRKTRKCETNEPLKHQSKAFSSLEACTINKCHDVETLFPVGWVPIFQHLELIEVEDCGNMKEIVAEGHGSAISLPWLKRIDLALLPQLSSIYKGRLVCASLISLSVMDCPRLTRMPFFFDKSKLLSLEQIEGQQQWWELLEWDQLESKTLLKPLFRCASSAYPGESSKGALVHGSEW